jgi:hypothetical protein
VRSPSEEKNDDSKDSSYEEVLIIFLLYYKKMGAWALRCAALLVGRSRDLFPVVSLWIFSVVPTKPCALGSTQPLKMSTRDFSWGKVDRCVWLTTYHPCSAELQDDPGL